MQLLYYRLSIDRGPTKHDTACSSSNARQNFKTGTIKTFVRRVL